MSYTLDTNEDPWMLWTCSSPTNKQRPYRWFGGIGSYIFVLYFERFKHK